MRMMSYVYDIKNELHEMSKAKSALDVECARLHKDVARLTQKVADLEAVNREEKDQATAAQNTLQAKVDMMLQMMTKCFAQLRTMAQSTQPLPPENASMSEMLDATVAYSNPESLENERLLSAFMSPMPLLTPALARPMDDGGASSPALNLDLDAVGGESAVKCAAVGHPYSCHCVPCNVFADHEEAGQANPGPEETPTRPASRAPSRRASTKRMKSGLSLTAPGKDIEAQERPASSAAGRHGRMRSVTTVGYHEGEAVAGGTDDTGDGNPMLRNRLHDLLNDPRSARNTPATVSASMPVMSSMPTRTRPVVAHSSLSAIPDAPSPTREEAAASSLLSSSSLRPQCLDEAPTEPTTATSNITSEHATPRRPSVVSHASKAALALEQTRRPSHHSSSGRESTTPFGRESASSFVREGTSSFVREGTSSSGRESTEPTPEDHLRATQPIPIQSHSRKRSDAADCAFGPLREYGASEGSFGASYRDGGGASYTGGASYSSRDNSGTHRDNGGTYRDNGVTYRETTPDRDVFGSPPAEAPYYPSVSRKASLRRPSAAQSSGSSGSIRTHRDT
ncbi:hypothetical protein K523DRAFT_338701 [Schizophyllum commune Tattone D]|nr:hypothetical protein K523DRAFT_338701 [Schizophyllum commune Tattone D]